MVCREEYARWRILESIALLRGDALGFFFFLGSGRPEQSEIWQDDSKQGGKET